MGITSVLCCNIKVANIYFSTSHTIPCRSLCPPHQVAAAHVAVLCFQNFCFVLWKLCNGKCTGPFAVCIQLRQPSERKRYLYSIRFCSSEAQESCESRKNRTRLKMKWGFHVDTESLRLGFIWYFWSKIQHIVYSWWDAHVLPCFMSSCEQRRKKSPKEFWTGGLWTMRH